MAGEIATAFVRIRPQTSGFKSDLQNQVSGASRGLGSQVAKAAALLGGAALAERAVSSVLKIGVAYRDSLNTFQAVTNATKTQMLQVSATAKQLGNDITIPGANASDAADAMTELARAGLSVSDSMNAARGSLQLAAAGEVEAKEAAQLMAGALNTFALRGTDAVRVADLLASTANSSAASVSDIAYGVQSAGSAAHAAGFNINELTTALGEMSNAGLSGDTAGTSFRSLLISLEKPSKQAQKALDRMNISIYDQHGKMKPLVDIIGQFERATKGMTAEQRNANFAQIAGTYGLQSLNVLVGKGSKAYLEMERANLKQGAASDLAAAKMKGLGGAARGFQNTIETAAISVFQKFSPSLERGVIQLNAFVGSITAGSGFGKVLGDAASFAANSVSQLVAGLQTGIGVLQTMAPVIEPVVHALGQIGAGPVLVAIGTFKALGAAQSLVAGTQGIIAKGMQSQLEVSTALGPALNVVAASESRAAAAAGELAIATEGAAVAQRSLATSSASSSLTGFASQLGGTARTAETLAGDAARVAPQVEAVGAKAAGAEGSVAALARGLTGMVSPTTALIGGAALLAGGLYWLSTRASAAERAAKATDDAFNKLLATSRAYAAATKGTAQGRQDTSDAKLQRDAARLGIQSAQAQVAADRKAGASKLQLAQDIINVRIANEQWRSSNKAVLDAQERTTASTKKATSAAQQHQQAIGALITKTNNEANVEAKVTTVAGKTAIVHLDAAKKVANFAAAYDKLAASNSKAAPQISNAAKLVAAYTRATGKVPTRAETTFIFNNAKAKTTYGDITKQLDAFNKRKVKAALGLDSNPFNDVIERVIGSAEGQGNQIGTNLTTGIAAGINAADIATPLIAKVRTAVAAAKKAAESKSPSRLTAREVGLPLAQGIALGIDQGTGTILSSVRKQSKTVGVTFVDGLAGFKKRAAAALDFNTVFTENLRGAIQSARDNLRTLGQTVSSSLGTFLDKQNDLAIAKLKANVSTGDPAIKAIQDRIAQRAHDSTVKQQADAVAAARKTIADLASAGGPDKWSTQAADDAVAEAQESLKTLQDTYGEQRSTLEDALTTAQNDLKTAVQGVAGTTTAGTGSPGSPGSPGKLVGSPFSAGTKIAGTYRPAVASTLTDDSTSGGTLPLDPLGQRAAARSVAQAQRALDSFDASYQRSVNSGTKAVNDAQVARRQLDLDYTQSVMDANNALTDALAAQLDQQDQDKADSLQKQLDDATTAIQTETDTHKAALDQRLNDLTDQLDRQQISLSTYNAAVLQAVNDEAPGWQAAGSTLGSSFVNGIQDAIAALLQQGLDVATGPARTAPPGSTSPVVNPKATQAADAATLRKAVLDARDVIKGDLATLAKDKSDAVKKSSEGGTKITTGEQAGINRDIAAGNKDYKELIVALRALAANAGWKEGMQIGSLTIANDPEQVVSLFLKNLAASQNK